MSQLSLFSADARPSQLGDLSGLLCGPGRITRFGAGDTARISLTVADAGRAAAVRAAAAPFGVPFELGERSCAGRELRTAYRRDLASLARAWTGPDRAKAVPAAFQLDGTGLRLWALASGRADGRGGYLLLLDPETPGTHGPLITAATRLGLPPARVRLPPCETCRAAPTPVDLPPTGTDGPLPVAACAHHHLVLAPVPAECAAAGPALRIAGSRRIQRLVELVGPAPEGVDPAGWPRYWGRNGG